MSTLCLLFTVGKLCYTHIRLLFNFFNNNILKLINYNCIIQLFNSSEKKLTPK